VDGVRDSAKDTRTDPFDLDHVELVNGANSVYSGSGSVGGSVNLVSKTPYLGDRTTLDLRVFGQDYCDVVREVWSKTPVVWDEGAAVLRAPPSDHRCAQPMQLMNVAN